MTFDYVVWGGGAGGYTTIDISARSGADYEPLSGSLLFEVGGATSKTLEVPVLDDEFDEVEESFRLDLLSAANATVDSSSGSATVSIADDDPYPELSVQGGTAIEGGQIVFTVSMFPLSGETVQVDVATSDDTAVAGADYWADSRRLSFAPGEASKTVEVTTVADALDEAEETLQLDLTNAQGSTISVASATGRIDDDDPPPSVSVRGGSAPEGGAVQFVVSLSTESGRPVGVNYASVDGTAVSGDDYEPVSARLQFEPGDLSKTVSVAVLEDDLDDSPETFELQLSDAVNASIGTGSAAGTIDGGTVPVGPVGPVGPGGVDPEPDEPTVWVPIIRSWALTRGFALLSGTRNRYEIWYTRTQHRPPSRQVNDHGRVSGTHTVSGRVVHGSASTARVSPTLI